MSLAPAHFGVVLVWVFTTGYISLNYGIKKEKNRYSGSDSQLEEYQTLQGVATSLEKFPLAGVIYGCVKFLEYREPPTLFAKTMVGLAQVMSLLWLSFPLAVFYFGLRLFTFNFRMQLLLTTIVYMWLCIKLGRKRVVASHIEFPKPDGFWGRQKATPNYILLILLLFVSPSAFQWVNRGILTFEEALLQITAVVMVLLVIIIAILTLEYVITYNQYYLNEIEEGFFKITSKLERYWGLAKSYSLNRGG
jgi:hypothetical protein